MLPAELTPGVEVASVGKNQAESVRSRQYPPDQQRLIRQTEVGMRVVIDTNVLVSGVISPHGPPGRIVNAVMSEMIIVLYDDRILKTHALPMQDEPGGMAC